MFFKNKSRGLKKQISCSLKNQCSLRYPCGTKQKRLYCLFISPFGRSATFFFFEKAVEIGAGRESTFGRNDVVVVVGIVEHPGCDAFEVIGLQHLHRRVETTVSQLPEERVGSRNVRFQCCQPARQSRGRNGESPLSEPLILEIIHNCLRLKLLNVSDVDGYSVHA